MDWDVFWKDFLDGIEYVCGSKFKPRWIKRYEKDTGEKISRDILRKKVINNFKSLGEINNEKL